LDNHNISLNGSTGGSKPTYDDWGENNFAGGLEKNAGGLE